MKKLFASLLSLSMLFAAASADSMLAGTVTSGKTEVAYAPYGGQAANIQVSEGDYIKVGDPIVDIMPTPVYAPVAGTVTAVFGQPGDSTENLDERYTAVLFMEPTSRYTINANTERAYASSATKMIHVGENVYLTCATDGSHMGTGVVISIGDSDEEGNTSYTVEVRSGTMLIGESIKICRASDYAVESCIGRGTVVQAKPVAVKGSGSILRIAVQPGDVVDRGELLFETVEGNLNGLYAVSNHLLSPISGIIAKADLEEGATVSQNAAILSVYPLSSLQVQVDIPLMDLASYHVGSSAVIEVDVGSYDPQRYTGTLARISRIANSDESKVKTVKAWIDFDADDTIVYGMPVNVYFTQNEAPATEATGDE